ncbi:Uncharacterised protein [Vibrio cholerae]|nr:Uncharacterised protein [Vibrio cholerae]
MSQILVILCRAVKFATRQECAVLINDVFNPIIEVGEVMLFEVPVAIFCRL